jgi:Undecaprenyl-phosphate glucose phosphotransferase
MAMPALEALLVIVEMLMLIATGLAVGIAAAAAHSDVKLPSPVAMAAGYLMLGIICDATARPPRRRRRGRALQVLLTLFVIGLLMSRDVVSTLPWMTLWFIVAASAISSWRWLAMRLPSAMPAVLQPARPAAFIGNSMAATRLLQAIEADPSHRLRPVGFFDDRMRMGPLHDKLPYLGTIDELVSYIHEHELRDVFMALPWSAGDRISSLIARLRFLPLTVHLIPDQMPPVIHHHKENNALEGIIMPTLMLPPFSPAGAFAKRALDLVCSAVLLLPLIPLFLLVALAIKLDSPGPVFFFQPRSGQFGRSFNVFKFRSLHVAKADTAAESLVQRGDSRVTRVGKYLRKYSIDELPQIINVLLGDMSLVGPRPHAPRAKAGGRIYAEVMPDYMLRYRVKPGMTGWAQVNGWRGNTDTEDKLRKRVEFDFHYIENWSMMRDIKILAMTVPSALFPPKDNV